MHRHVRVHTNIRYANRQETVAALLQLTLHGRERLEKDFP